MKDLMTTVEASRYLRQAVGTLAKWRVYGKGPRSYKIGRTVLYNRVEVDAWIDSNGRRSTSDVLPAESAR